jgi:DNA-binding Lrp family transcriptional regulator
MRPIASEQNSLRYPLNELFGTQAHVRLLRVLANEVDGPLTASDAAARAGLTVPGAQKALRRLFQSGFVTRIGGGRNYQYSIRLSDRLVLIALELFQTEKARYEELLDAITTTLENLTPHPQSVWIQAFPRKLGEPLALGVMHETRHLSNFIRRFRMQLNRVEQDFDLTIEVDGYTKADIPDLKAEEVTSLYGALPLPDNYGRQLHPRPLTHEESDHRMMELSRRLADVVEHDASLVRRAKEHVDRLLLKDQGLATRDIAEWRDILRLYSIPRLSRFLTSSSERANRLRQSNPFFAILSSKEKARLMSGLEDNRDTRAT